MDELSTRLRSLFQPRKVTTNLPQFLSQKSGQTQNPQIEKGQPISYKTNFSQNETMRLVDVKFNITYQNKEN